MSDAPAPTQTPQEQAAAIAAQWREGLAFVQLCTRRARYEYTSKHELRDLALSALATLEKMYGQAVARAEEAANGPVTESAIVVPGSDASLLTPEAPSGGLITL